MPIFSRGYRPEDDFQRVMGFLRDTYAETKSLRNWFPSRFENSRVEMAPHTRLWEEFKEGTMEPRIVAMANPEIEFLYFIQIHPDYSLLEEEIIQWIEDHSASQKPDPSKELRLTIVSLEGNPAREAALRKRGFEKGPVYGILRLRSVGAPIPNHRPPDGFKIRSVQPTDFDRIADGIRAVFGHGEWFTGEVLEEISRTSFYREELDLVAVAPDGSIASFCTFRIDTPSGVTELEPIGTLPEYRELGLAKALLSEGFKRLRKYRPTLLYIGGAANTPEANRLYEVMGFTEAYNYHFWHKMV